MQTMSEEYVTRLNGPVTGEDTFPHTAPASLVDHRFERSFDITAAVEDVWAWLNDPRTFIDAQVPPYRVEFVPERFEVGILNNHHGPFLSLPALITVMDAPHYREMKYLYGSYVVSLRWIRPCLLAFALRADGERTQLTVRLDCWVHPWLRSVWSGLQRVFWAGFGWGIGRQVRAHRRRRNRLT